MKLTTNAIKAALPKEKTWKLFDGGGLHVEIRPNGAKYWRLAYRFGGKEKRVSFGVFPETTLKDARIKTASARELLDEGVDPSAHRRAKREALAATRHEATRLETDSFEVVARDWHSRQAGGWAPKHADKVLARLENDIFPWVGGQLIDAIEPPELLRVLRRIESRGAIDTAHRAKWSCSQVFRYAIACGKATRDPAADVTGALTPIHNREHFASIKDPAEIGKLLRALEAYAGTYVVRGALQLAPLLFVRPGELRHMEWTELDFELRRWTIPPAKMKLRKMIKAEREARGQPHLVPLSVQACVVLKELKPLTGEGKYVFPSARGGHRPMSENAVTVALRNMGYEGKVMTGHGFRSMATTRLRELGWDMEVIDRQLAHIEANKVTAAYNHAEHIDRRIDMMQAWADYLDSLKAGGSKVTPIRSGA